ncbi:MAG: hypothetical protein R3F61_14900 [Myxococcota bacterium]
MSERLVLASVHTRPPPVSPWSLLALVPALLPLFAAPSMEGPAGPLTALLAISTLVAIGGYHLLRPATEVVVEFADGEVAFVTSGARQVLDGTLLVLDGAPGSHQILRLGDTVLVRWEDRPSAEITQLAMRAAHLARVPLDDRRDLARFSDWEGSPARRVAMQFEQTLRTNAREFASLWSLEPREPYSTGDHDTITYHLRTHLGVDVPITLSKDGVRAQDSIPFEAIRDARVAFKTVGTVTVAELLVRRDTSVVMLAGGALDARTVSEGPGDSRSGALARELMWVAERLRTLAESASARSVGTRDDIPAALRAMRSTE